MNTLRHACRYIVETGGDIAWWDAFEALCASEADSGGGSGPSPQPSGGKGYTIFAESDQVIGKLSAYVAPYNPEAIARFISEGA